MHVSRFAELFISCRSTSLTLFLWSLQTMFLCSALRQCKPMTHHRIKNGSGLRKAPRKERVHMRPTELFSFSSFKTVGETKTQLDMIAGRFCSEQLSQRVGVSRSFVHASLLERLLHVHACHTRETWIKNVANIVPQTLLVLIVYYLACFPCVSLP